MISYQITLWAWMIYFENLTNDPYSGGSGSICVSDDAFLEQQINFLRNNSVVLAAHTVL